MSRIITTAVSTKNLAVSNADYSNGLLFASQSLIIPATVDIYSRYHHHKANTR